LRWGRFDGNEILQTLLNCDEGEFLDEMNNVGVAKVLKKGRLFSIKEK
jgi:hypothetical protein